jgi:hypothetical protein
VIYTVTWLPSAIDELTELWIQASDRQAVSVAANRIDRRLRIDAHVQGAEHQDVRILNEPPLMVTFAVYPDDCLAEVIQVVLAVP